MKISKDENMKWLILKIILEIQKTIIFIKYMYCFTTFTCLDRCCQTWRQWSCIVQSSQMVDQRYWYENHKFAYKINSLTWIHKYQSFVTIHPGQYKINQVWESFVTYYSIHVPGGLQKWLNLITAPGSVSNEHGSVTWLATKYLRTVSWRNHTEKLT